MAAPIRHLEILGPDRAELVRFYRDAFGWTFDEADEDPYTLFLTGGGMGGGVGRHADGETAVSLFAHVDSISNLMMKAQELRSPEQFGPFELGDGSRTAKVRDPAGNLLGLYEGPGRDATEGTGAAIVWFDLLAPEPKDLAGFYRELFGWTIEDSDGYAHVTAEAGGIGGGISAPHPGMPGNATIGYIHASNIEEQLQTIERAGGTTVSGRRTVGEGVDIALFRDPAGNLLGLTEWSPA